VNLPAGGTVTFNLTGTINPAATGTIVNTATVTVPVGVTETNPANNTSTDTDTLTPQADLGITKSDGHAAAQPGQAITYTIVVSNPGPSNVTADGDGYHRPRSSPDRPAWPAEPARPERAPSTTR
jgi:hypothetical protein